MKKFRKLFGLILLMVFLLASFYAVKKVEDGQLDNSSKNELAKRSHTNPDVYAWVKVEGTNIDDPIAQHPDDDTYYLSHDLEHQETYYGAIFTERVNTKTFEDLVTIIYGHAIQDGSMFGSLENFADRSTFNQFKTITIETVNNHFTYDIIAAYQANDDHLFYTYQLGQKVKVKDYITHIENQAKNEGGFYRQVSFDIEKDKLLILSTCDAQSDEKRFVVHAIRRSK